MNVKPFRFKLEKVDARSIALYDALFRFLPKRGLRDTFVQGLHEALSTHIGSAVHCTLEGMNDLTFGEFTGRLARPAVVVAVGLAPLEEKLFIDIDPSTAERVVDRMIGGHGERTTASRSFSDIEQGVLQYLLLQLLAHVHRLCGEDPHIHFRCERIVTNAQELHSYAKASEKVIVLVFRLSLGDVDGFVRLAFPYTFVEGAFQRSTTSRKEKRERDDRTEKIVRYGSIRFPLWVELGRTTLTGAELSEVETGDVILLDHVDVVLEKGEPKGKVIVRAGWGHEYGVMADITVDGRHARCRLLEEVKGSES